MTPERFAVAFRLIGHAQSQGGQGEVKSDWIATRESPPSPLRGLSEGADPDALLALHSTTAGPFPRFQGFPTPEHLGTGAAPFASATASSPAPTAQPAPLQPQGTGSAGVSITPEEKARYAKLFNNSGPVAGLLDGKSAALPVAERVADRIRA